MDNNSFENHYKIIFLGWLFALAFIGILWSLSKSFDKHDLLRILLEFYRKVMVNFDNSCKFIRITNYGGTTIF